MKHLSIAEALREGIAEDMRRDPSVFDPWPKYSDRQADTHHLASDGNCILYYSHPQHPSSTFVAGKAVAIVLAEGDPATADVFSPFDFTGDAFVAGGRLGTRLGS
jgi:hypothetical protein